MRHLNGEDVRGEQPVNGLAVLIAEFAGFVGFLLDDQPLEADARIQNVDHSASRNSRMAGVPMSRTPCLWRICSLIRSMRSQACRMVSGSRRPFAARAAASWSSAM